MITDPQCAVCVLNDVFKAVDLLSLNRHQRNEVVKRVIAMLNKDFTLDKVPSKYITSAHRILKDVTGLANPFSEVRSVCNRVGQQLARVVRTKAQSITDGYLRFRFIVQWTIVANSMDIRTVGAGYELAEGDLYEKLLKVFSEGLAVDDTVTLYNTLKKSRKVLYILDNVGEIAVDRLLIEEIKLHGSEVVVAVKGGPITSDATIDDLECLSVDKSADKVIISGPDTLGISFEEMTEDMKNEIAQADLTIGKGQANFYVISTFRDRFPGSVACLFSTKCDVISRIFSKKGKLNIAKIL